MFKGKAWTLLGIAVIFGLIFIRLALAASPLYSLKMIIVDSLNPGNTAQAVIWLDTKGETLTSAKVSIKCDTAVVKYVATLPVDAFAKVNTQTFPDGTITLGSESATGFSGSAEYAKINFRILSSSSSGALCQLTKNPDSTYEQQVLPTQYTSSTYYSPTPNPSTSSGQVPSATLGASPTSLQPTTNPTSPSATLGAGNPSPTTSLPADCEQIDGSGGYVIVFLADNYSNLDTFRTDVQTSVTNMKNTNLGAVLNKLSYRLNTKINIDYQVDINSNTAPFDLEQAEANKSLCGGSAYVILTAKYPNFEATAGTGGVSAIKDGMSLVCSFALFAVPHELAHSVAGLFDEYNFKLPYDAPISVGPYYNCSGDDQSRCSEWKNSFPADNELGCFSICGFRNWYRPTQVSAMNNNLSAMNKFNNPSLAVWNNVLQNY